MEERGDGGVNALNGPPQHDGHSGPGDGHRSNSKSANDNSGIAARPQKSKFSSSQTDNADVGNRVDGNMGGKGDACSSTSNENRGATNEGRWSKHEHHSFLKALKLHGRDWKRVARTVQTRTSTQCRSHAQKFIVSLEKQGRNLDEVLGSDILMRLGEDGMIESNSASNVSDNRISKFKQNNK